MVDSSLLRTFAQLQMRLKVLFVWSGTERMCWNQTNSASSLVCICFLMHSEEYLQVGRVVFLC